MMNTLSTVTDSITEVLAKIIDFTERRGRVLQRNITGMNEEGFEPKDLDAAGFADVMMQAVVEYIRKDRLVLYDIETVRFGQAGEFETVAVFDHQAQQALMESREGYLQMQINKLSENMLNGRVARELLRQKQLRSGMIR